MRRRRTLAVLLLLLCLGCGHRGPLIPPLPRRPIAPEQATLRQRGGELEIDARYRTRLLSQGALRPPVEAVLMVIPIGSREMAAPLMSEQGVRGFEEAARLVPIATLEAERAEASVSSPAGGAMRRDRLAVGQLGPGAAFVVAVALQDRRDRSLPSRRWVYVPLIEPLAAPGEASATSLESGVQLRWAAPADPRVKQLRVYRWHAGREEPREPWKTLAGEARELLDTEAQFADRLFYRVAAVAEAGELSAESDGTVLGPIAHDDLFPPRPPHDLDALPEAAQIRVLWYPGGSNDEASFLVERQAEGDDSWRAVGKVAAGEAMYVDGPVPPGVRLRYRLIAVDRSGNRAMPTEPTEWVTPRVAP